MPQAPTENSAQFVLGVELRVSGAKRKRKEVVLTHLIAGLDQNQDFHWSHGGEEPDHQNDSLMTNLQEAARISQISLKLIP